MRIVLVSTPRSGNNWLRHLLASLYDIPSLSVHNPADLDWATLPPDCVLGIHWHAVPPFLTLLERHGFRAVTLARHPLDVLLSIMHFALYAPTARWLEGEGGDERSIYGAMPRSAAFLEYAASNRATALLRVSREWWAVPDCLRVRYEELVADPGRALDQLADDLGVVPRWSVDAALDATTLPKLRDLTHCPHHFWQGRPGLWRSLLPPAEARAIVQAQPSCFSALAYAGDADPELQGRQADANWIELVGADLAREIQNLGSLKQQLEASQRLTEELQAKLRASQHTCADLQRGFGASQQALQELTNQWERGRVVLERVKDIGPLALGIAARLHRLALHYPRTARLIRRLARGRAQPPLVPGQIETAPGKEHGYR